MSAFDGVLEASVAQLRAALDAGQISSVRLVAAYLERLGAYDRRGQVLNSVPVLNPAAFREAREADRRRAVGVVRSPLDGIPFTAKDSYKVFGLPVSAGSPAFEELIAGEDAFSISRLREAGAICLGLSTMPPMANGGMQRGLHGRAESPYNAAYLTSAWASGSSNGSGTATAASFGAFGLGEETWSSGRAPANNNSLCAYTPSWGVISMRGNWPLVPTMDVVVPHARSMEDLLLVLDEMVADDPQTRGDFWRVQQAVAIPASSELRPASYTGLLPGAAASLSGLRLGVPRIYKNVDGTDGKAAVQTRPSVVGLLDAAIADLAAAGATVVDCDLPALTAYEGTHAFLGEGGGFQGGLEDLGYQPEGYLRTELIDLAAWALEDFLRANADTPGARGPKTLLEVDPDKVFPTPIGQIEDEFGEDFGMGDYVRFVQERGVHGPAELPGLDEGLRGLDRARRELFDEWLDAEGLDAIILPTSADIAPADADQDPAGHELAWRNGTWVANGNLLWRHLGIPTVTVPMGLAADIGMPFGLTWAGRGWDDARLLGWAAGFEATGARRQVPGVVPELGHFVGGTGAGAEPGTEGGGAAGGTAWELGCTATAEALDAAWNRVVVRLQPARVTGAPAAEAAGEASVRAATVSVDGVLATQQSDGTFAALVPASQRFHSQWRARYGHLVVAVAALDLEDASTVELGTSRILGGC